MALYAVLDAVFIALNNVTAGAAGRARSVVSVLLVAAPTSLLLVLAATLLVPGTPTVAAARWGLAAGVLGGSGLLVAYRAFAIGPIGAASAGAQCTATVLVTLVGAWQLGSLPGARWVGLLICLVAILLICPPGGRPDQVRGPALGVAAGALFGSFVLLTGQAPDGAGLWTIVAARVGVFVVVGVAAVSAWRSARRGSGFPAARVLGPGFRRSILVGASDGAANVFLALALLGGDLVLVALIGTVAPAITALIGRALLGDVLSRGQVVGLVCAVVGAAAALV